MILCNKTQKDHEVKLACLQNYADLNFTLFSWEQDKAVVFLSSFNSV